MEPGHQRPIANTNEMQGSDAGKTLRFGFVKNYVWFATIGYLVTGFAFLILQPLRDNLFSSMIVFAFAIVNIVVYLAWIPKIRSSIHIDWASVVVFVLPVVNCALLANQSESKPGLTILSLCLIISAICINSTPLYLTASMISTTALVVIQSILDSAFTTNEWILLVAVFPCMMLFVRRVMNDFFERLEIQRENQTLLVAELRDSIQALTTNQENLVSTEASLWQKQFHLDAILRHAPLVLCILDHRGVYIQSRGNGLAKLGLKENELVGKPFDEIYAGHDDVIEAIQSAIDGNPSQVRTSLAEGLFHEIRYQPFRTLDGSKQGVVGVGVDISEWVQEEKNRRILEEQVFQSQKNESLGSLAGGVAHDFNNYLMAIVAFAESLKLRIENSVDSQAQEQLLPTVDSIESTALNAAGVCQQMLLLAGKTRESKDNHNLNDIVNNSLALIKASAPKTITVELNLQSDPLVSFIDDLLVQRALFNVFKNAVESVDGKPGRIVISTRQELLDSPEKCDDIFVGTVSETTSYACIEVSDSGPGMDAETCKRIFEPYFSTKPQGHGFGLAITSGIVNQHNGLIRCQPSSDGTKIVLMFPTANVASNSNEALAMGAPHQPPPNGSKRILLVDDEPNVRLATERLLEEVGHAVTTASSGEEALEILTHQEDLFDCVLLDYSMRGMDGLAALQTMRNQGISTPVIICSGYMSEAFNKQASIAEGVLTKPFTMKNLANAITAASARIRPQS